VEPRHDRWHLWHRWHSPSRKHYRRSAKRKHWSDHQHLHSAYHSVRSKDHLLSLSVTWCREVDMRGNRRPSGPQGCRWPNTEEECLCCSQEKPVPVRRKAKPKPIQEFNRLAPSATRASKSFPGAYPYAAPGGLRADPVTAPEGLPPSSMQQGCCIQSTFLPPASAVMAQLWRGTGQRTRTL